MSISEHSNEVLSSELALMLKEGRNTSDIVEHFRQRGVPVPKTVALIRECKREIPTETLTAELVQTESAPPVQVENFTDKFNEFMQANPNGDAPATPPIGKTLIQKEPPKNHHVTHLSLPTTTGVATKDYTAGNPSPIRDGYPNFLTIKGRVVSVAFQKYNPDVLVVDNVLTEQECQQIIDLASSRVTPSSVVSNEDGGNVKHEARTSSGAHFNKSEIPLLRWMEEFCAELLQWPYVNSEGFQILNYKMGQRYLAHFDHFDDSTEGGRVLLNTPAGNRVATVLIYLNDTPAGGGTQFPNLGITVTPKRGRLLYFGFPDAKNANDLLHAGMPPIEGEKWVAVNWFRQGRYSS